MEADGEWHSEDNKFGSATWKAQHPAPPAKPVSPTKRVTSPARPAPTNGTNGTNGKDKPRPSNAEIVILDTDDEDEDEGRVKRELSPSTDGALPRTSTGSGSQPSRSQATDIIDLTLDSDDDDPPPRRQFPLTKKRKEMDDLPSPTESIWKKSRTDGAPSSSAPSLMTPASNSMLRTGEEGSVSRRLPPLPSQPRHLSSSQPSPFRGSGSVVFGSSGGAPPPRRPSPASNSNYGHNTLPPLSSYPSQRGSGAGASSPRNWRP